jgi:signal transduction histidine kinase/ActR/RegA family two-component response regulator
MFGSKVARRAFALFIACALLPVCALAILSLHQVTSELQEQGERRLRQASKGMGFVLLNRLLAAEEALDQAAERGAASVGRFPHPLAAAQLAAPGDPGQVLFGEMHPPALTEAQRARLAAGKTVLSTQRDGAGHSRLTVSRAAGDRGVVHGAIDPAFLWALGDDAALPPDTALIVLDEAGHLLFSSIEGGATPDALVREAARSSRNHFEWSDGGEEYVATRWALFLRASMGVPQWTVVLSQRKADVLAPISAFKRIFVLVVVLTILTVLFLSGRQIRRSLTPLVQLKQGAQRLSMGDLDARVTVKSRDEFAEVASAFNDMASQLGRQFRTLGLRRDIAASFSGTQPLEEFLRQCVDAMARQLSLPAVGIWLVDSARGTLERRAGARLDGSADRPPLDLPITRRERDRVLIDGQPFVTNSLLDDPRRGDLAWAADEGYVAFLAHPVSVEGRVLGLVGAFARRAFEATELSTVGLAADDIARSIDRRSVDDALRESELQTRQLQKMEAVGRLAGGIAHDFNNLLTVITGRTYLLLQGLAEDHPHRKGIQTIEATAQRAAMLTRQLLAFSRKQILAPTVLDLNEVVAGFTEILHRLIGEDIELTFTPAPDLGRCRLDRGQVEQVLVNLVVNARDAMPQGGRIAVTTTNVLLDEESVRRGGGSRPGPHVRIAVTDTGTGMDEHTRARIFEPFFTTKEVGKGTGLGLATVLGIVQQSEGQIRVESQVGVGTTFEIYFPCVEESATPTDHVAAPPRGGTETVLVVDDEPEVQALIQTALAAWGYSVLGATSASQALRLAESHPGPIDLLLTDMVMPEMSGAALAQRLSAVRPQIAVVHMSGYIEYAAEATADRHGLILQKPFAPDTVARMIRNVLDARDAPPPEPSRAPAPEVGLFSPPTVQLT